MAVERIFKRNSNEEAFKLINAISDRVGPWASVHNYTMEFIINPFDKSGSYVVIVRMFRSYEQNTIKRGDEKPFAEA